MLLDNFVRAVTLEKLKAAEEEELANMKALGLSKADGGNPLDPLLEALSSFKTEVINIGIACLLST